jgi:ferrochelatase
MTHKKGILLMAYGSPNSIEDIEPYYTDIRKGRKPTPELLEELTDRYQTIGGKTPLLQITTEQMNSLQELVGDQYQIFLGMRHWNPWIAEAIQEMKDAGITQAVGIIMAPHFSSMSIAKYIECVEKGMEKVDYHIPFKYIQNWHVHPSFLEGLIEKIEIAENNFAQAGVDKSQLHYIFTAHSLPEKILEVSDPYRDQLLETCRWIAKLKGISNWDFAFQSAGRTQEKWLGPDLLDKIEELHQKGQNNILICSVGFIIDHLEVLYDIDIEAKEYCATKGIRIERAPSLNNHPKLTSLFKEIIDLKFEDFR